MFTDEPSRVCVVWLFSLVLGYSRFLTGQFVYGQHLANVLRCHMQAFAELGGVPRQILYDRMKTAVLGETKARHVIYHPRLLELAEHYGFTPRACAPYRAKTKGKVEVGVQVVERWILARLRNMTFFSLDNAILDHLVRNAYRLHLKEESMRKMTANLT